MTTLRVGSVPGALGRSWVQRFADAAAQAEVPLGRLAIGSLDSATVRIVPITDVADGGLDALAVLPRADVRSVVVTSLPSLADAPDAARVVVGDVRYGSQVEAMKPGVVIDVVDDGPAALVQAVRDGADAAIVPADAFRALAPKDLRGFTLTVEAMCPVPGQGAVGVWLAEDADDELRARFAALDDPVTRECVAVEREVGARLADAGVRHVSAYARYEGDRIVITARVTAHEGGLMLTERTTSPTGFAASATTQVVHALLSRGAARLSPSPSVA